MDRTCLTLELAGNDPDSLEQIEKTEKKNENVNELSYDQCSSLTI